MEFVEYELKSEILCMGERVKGGIFRPCVHTIPYSQITGALKKKFGKNLHAVGYLIQDGEHNQTDYLIYSPRDRFKKLSKLPLQTEVLANVLGRIFIPLIESFDLPENFEIRMGAFLSKGFGKCKLNRINTITISEVKKGILSVRIPEKYRDIFGIKNVIKPVYGYLFEPITISQGIYTRSLFEGSVVFGPNFLLKEEGNYG